MSHVGSINRLLKQTNPAKVDWTALHEITSLIKRNSVNTLKLPLKVYETLIFPAVLSLVSRNSNINDSYAIATGSEFVVPVFKAFLGWQRPIDFDTWSDFLVSLLAQCDRSNDPLVEYVLSYHERIMIPGFPPKKVFEATISKLMTPLSEHVLQSESSRDVSERIFMKSFFPEEFRDAWMSLFPSADVKQLLGIREHIETVKKNNQASYHKVLFECIRSCHLPMLFKCFASFFKNSRKLQMIFFCVIVDKYFITQADNLHDVRLDYIYELFMLLGKFRSFTEHRELANELVTSIMDPFTKGSYPNDLIPKFIETVVISIAQIDLSLLEGYLGSVISAIFKFECEFPGQLIEEVYQARKIDVLVRALLSVLADMGDNIPKALQSKSFITKFETCLSQLNEAMLLRLLQKDFEPVFSILSGRNTEVVEEPPKKKSKSKKKSSKEADVQSSLPVASFQLFSILLRRLNHLQLNRIEEWKTLFSPICHGCIELVKDKSSSLQVVLIALDILTTFSRTVVVVIDQNQLSQSLIKWAKKRGIPSGIRLHVQKLIWMQVRRMDLTLETKQALISLFVDQGSEEIFSSPREITLLGLNLKSFLAYASSTSINLLLDFISKSINSSCEQEKVIMGLRFLSCSHIFENEIMRTGLVNAVESGNIEIVTVIKFIPLSVFMKGKKAALILEKILALKSDSDFEFCVKHGLSPYLNSVGSMMKEDFLLRMLNGNEPISSLESVVLNAIRMWVKEDKRSALKNIFTSRKNTPFLNKVLSFLAPEPLVMKNFLLIIEQGCPTWKEFKLLPREKLISTFQLICLCHSFDPKFKEKTFSKIIKKRILKEESVEGRLEFWTLLIAHASKYIKEKVFKSILKDIYASLQDGGDVVRKAFFAAHTSRFEDFSPFEIIKAVSFASGNQVRFMEMVVELFGQIPNEKVSTTVNNLNLFTSIQCHVIQNFMKYMNSSSSSNVSSFLRMCRIYLQNTPKKGNYYVDPISANSILQVISLTCHRSDEDDDEFAEKYAEECYYCFYEFARDFKLFSGPLCATIFSTVKTLAERGPGIERHLPRLYSTIANLAAQKGSNRFCFSKYLVILLCHHLRALTKPELRASNQRKVIHEACVYNLISAISESDLQSTLISLGKDEKVLLQLYQANHSKNFKYRGKV